MIKRLSLRVENIRILYKILTSRPRPNRLSAFNYLQHRIWISNNYGVNINSVTFHYFVNEAGDEYLSRVFQTQPDQVSYRTKTRRDSKRKPRLTPEELQRMADDIILGNLYRILVDALGIHLRLRPTRSSMAFYGKIGDRSLAIFSLDVTESSAGSGLKFHVYFHRFIEYFNLDDQTALDLLPENSTETDIFPGSEEDYYAYEGYFQTEEQVSNFLSGLNLG
jgi:hypothetical protein